MSAISGDSSSINGAALTPQEQADAALFGTSGSVSTGETAQESADATLLDVTGSGSSSVSSDLEAGVPPDLTAASALVSDLAGQIGQSGSGASSAYSLLSADAALKLTTPS